MSTTHGIKVLQKLRHRNCIEVAPFVDIIELNNRLIVANSQLLSEREEIQFVNVKLKEETQKLRLKSSEADQEQVSVLEKKLFAAQEELTELHRRRGENAQQIIDQTALAKENEMRIKELQEMLDLSGKCDSKLGFIYIIISTFTSFRPYGVRHTSSFYQIPSSMFLLYLCLS